MSIPKVIVQTSFYRLPKYIEDLNKSKCIGWTYKYFTDNDIIKFIEENPLDEFKDSAKVFNSFSGAHKADFFRYYFLYTNGGVYIDSDAILEQNIDDIIENCSFFTVKSCLNNASVFNGFIGSEPKNDTIYKALKNAYNTPAEKLKTDYFLLCKNLYKIIEYKIEYEDFFANNDNLLFDEAMPNDTFATTLNKKKEVILKHYFNKDYVIPPITPIKNALKSISITKVGISFDMHGPLSTLFCNGIKQNALYFYDLLLNAGYECSLIVDNSLWSNINTEIGNDYKLTKQSDLLTCEYDIIFIFGCEIKPMLLKYLKNMDTKIVFYVCGNHYLTDSEKILYNCDTCSHNNNNIGYKSVFGMYDEVWLIPQMVCQNKYYLQTILKTKCIEVPFIWSAKSIELSSKGHNIPIDEFLYKIRAPQKKIAIFEPNLSVMKWGFPALLVCENAYTSKLVDKNIDHIYITNIGADKKTFNKSKLNNLTSTLDIKKNGIVSIEERYNTLKFMRQHADIAVSHQWENPLNYLYFDLAWMGWPILHNAYLCKDIGYYYSDFNYDEASEKLNEIINNHDANKLEYMKENRKIIENYLPTNVELQNKYKNMIENLFL